VVVEVVVVVVVGGGVQDMSISTAESAIQPESFIVTSLASRTLRQWVAVFNASEMPVGELLTVTDGSDREPFRLGAHHNPIPCV
jgi:hypothetical protein